MKLEHRISRFALRSFGEPIASARSEFKRIYEGELIGGGFRSVDITLNTVDRSATFAADDIKVTIK